MSGNCRKQRGVGNGTGGHSGPAAPDRREASRNMAVLRVAVLIRGETRQLCLVRNISPGGLMARIFSDVAAGDPVEVELQADRRISGRIAWTQDGHAGLQFDRPIDIGDVLTPPALKAGWRLRMPRLPVDRLAMIRSGAEISFASTRNVSQGGVQVISERPLERGLAVVVTLEGFRPIEGVVRWQRDGCCGISFNQVIPPADLSRWLASSPDGHRQ